MRFMPGRRRTWIHLGVALAGIGLLVGSVAWWLGWPERTGPRVVADRAEVISLAIPEGWIGLTRRNARQIVPEIAGRCRASARHRGVEKVLGR